jgi:tRNA A37 threonylcarbamoyladenosine dehydratase
VQDRSTPKLAATTANSTGTSQRSMPADLRAEQISRHTLYFGEHGMAKLKDAKICLVGVGGVGSHAACSLARSGLGYLRVVDFDQVSLSSLNRHACARLCDVGRSKVAVLTEFLQQVCPDPTHLQLEACNEMYTAATGGRLLETGDDDKPWTLVVDAIDDIPTKARLIADCLQRKIRVISCMGAGGKADVTRLHISDLRGANKDPLATKLRQSLKKIISDDVDATYLDDMDRLAIVYSSEKTVVGLADFTDEQKEQGVHQFGAVDGMRIRIIPVLSTMPAVMGQALAALALTELGGKALQPVVGERVGRNTRNKMLQKLKTRESRFAKQFVDAPGYDKIPELGGSIGPDQVFVGPIWIDECDVEYLLEIWRNRCAVTGARLGTVLQIVRWDTKKPGTCDNLVILSTNILQAFEKTGPDGVDPFMRGRIEERLATCKIDSYS